jgi:hypothetical protein
MDELRFRIVGISKDQVRNWRKLAQDKPNHSLARQRVTRAWRAASRTTQILTVLVTVAILDYVVSANPSVQDVVGRRVLVLLDTSGSMGNTTERKDQQLAALKAHNISVTEPFSTGGYAISSANASYSLLQPLRQAVAANPLADTIYIISDFKGGRESDNDAAGYQQFRDLIRARHLTLYFCTVDQVPPLPEYYDIASGSGGAVIEDYRNTQ